MPKVRDLLSRNSRTMRWRAPGAVDPRHDSQMSRSGLARIGMLSVAAGVLLTACGASAGASTGTTTGAPVNVSLWESHNGGPVGDAMTSLVNAFNSSHKSDHVTIVVTKASKKLLAAVAAGNPPVLAEISHYDGSYVKGNALVSWNSLIGGSSELSQSNFVPSVWSNGEVNGQHYRLEVDSKVSIVDYNKALFAQAGITSPPTTWTELASDAAKLKALGVIPIGWKDSSAHILPALMSNGGTLLKGSNTVGTSTNFDSAAGQSTFTYFHNLAAAGELQFHHGTTLRQDLAAGKMAMIDGTSAGYQKTLIGVGGKFPVGAFVEPAGSAGYAANLVQGLGFVLPKGHTHAQDEAALTFVKWWFEPAQQVRFAELTGFPPETKAAIAAMPASFLASHPGQAATIQAVESPHTVPRPVSDSYKEVQAALDTAFYNAVTGKTSVAAALQTLQAQANSYMSGASAI